VERRAAVRRGTSRCVAQRCEALGSDVERSDASRSDALRGEAGWCAATRGGEPCSGVLRGAAKRSGAGRGDAVRSAAANQALRFRRGDKVIIHSIALKLGKSLDVPRATFSTRRSVTFDSASRANSRMIASVANRACSVRFN
jgi:hypothetical protein